MIEFCQAPIVVETPAPEQVDHYRLGECDELCTVRPHHNHPTTMPRSDRFECAWPSWCDYIYRAETAGSCWDRCRYI